LFAEFARDNLGGRAAICEPARGMGRGKVTFPRPIPLAVKEKVIGMGHQLNTSVCLVF